ncbi:hypothetical protein PC129_g25142 [Phytophthora cactorum]|uniref:Uncharacterized protein n=1 Tax=Phytophthora cactorum TaxID=29920 RepID=A0A8T1GYY1_9STRA|nr:hypothetical protein PC129_g25142 [Phytophthora cactorum]
MQQRLFRQRLFRLNGASLPGTTTRLHGECWFSEQRDGVAMETSGHPRLTAGVTLDSLTQEARLE